tara:strand:- start:212 stop:496 length:285 start_codon:yes stop_codon:yes gene_type:complete
MKKVWIAQNISKWVSVDLDKIESFHYEGDGKSTYLFIDNKRIVKDVHLELFCALETYLVNILLPPNPRFKEETSLRELLHKVKRSNEERQEEEA